MRRWVLFVSLLVFCSVCGNSFAPLEILSLQRAFGTSLTGFASSSQGLIEIDLIENQVKLVNFNLGSCKVNGEFIFALDKDDSSLTLGLAGSNITFGDKGIPWVRAILVLGKNIIVIPYIYSPQFIANGEVDLEKNELNLNLEGSWKENSSFLEGEVKVKVKAWGGLNSFLTSGYLVVDGGKYKGKDFTHLRIDFLGRLPMLNITDSQLILKNGNVVEIKGVLDLRDFSNILPGAEYSPQKVFIDQWQLFSGDNESIGLKKQIDEKFDVSVKADGTEEGESGPKTELRYNWKDDKFLKLRMEEKGTSLRIEKRKEF